MGILDTPNSMGSSIDIDGDHTYINKSLFNRRLNRNDPATIIDIISAS